MATVPTYDGPQVREQPQQGGYQDANQYMGAARNMQDLGKGLDAIGAITDRIAQRDAQRTAYEAQSNIQAKFLDYQQQYEKQRQGGNAKGLTNDVDTWWSDASKNLGATLDPLSRSIVNRALGQSRLQAIAAAGHFENANLEKATDTAWTSAKTTTISAAAAAPNVMVPGPPGAEGIPTEVTAAEAAISTLRKMNAEYAVHKGVDASVLSALNLEDSTKLNTQVLQSLMLSGLPDAAAQAKAYYEKNKDSINGTLHAEIELKLRTTGLASQAQTFGAELAAQFDYTHTGDALLAIDKHEDWSAELKAAVRGELEHRHVVLQSDARAQNADLVGKLSTLVQSGASLATIKASPEYNNPALRDQGIVLAQIQAKQDRDLARSNALLNRDFALAGQLEAKTNREQAGAAFAYSDPTVLAGMDRSDIAALRIQLGNSWTEKLLAKKDSFVRSEAKQREAKMDQDDFNQVAHGLGLHPYKATSEDEKATLGEVKDRTELLINAWQVKNGREMPREEKRKLMGVELATELTINNTWWLNGTTNPLQIKPDEIKNIKVPEIDRGQIITRYQEMKKDPKYMPTAQEIGQAYLNKKQLEAAGLHAK